MYMYDLTMLASTLPPLHGRACGTVTSAAFRALVRFFFSTGTRHGRGPRDINLNYTYKFRLGLADGVSFVTAGEAESDR